MEEETNESGSFVSIPESNIRSAQVNIQAQLDRFKITSDTTYVQTSYFCDNVRDQILNYDDEPHLSKNQNNYRRIYIASELFIKICSTYAQIVDYEYGKIISSMVQWKKFKQLARKINSKMQLEIKREKFFSKEAQGKLLDSLGDVVEEVNEVAEEVTPRRESEIVSRNEREKVPVNKELVQLPEQTIPGQVIHETFRTSSGLETSFRDDFPSNIIGNITELREDPKADTHHSELPLSNISRRELAFLGHQTLEPELSIGDPTTIQQKTDDDIDHILSILEKIFPKDLVEPEPPVKVLQQNKKPIISEELMTTENVANGNDKAPQDSEEWTLPSIQAVERTKKKRSLIIDKATFIPSYAAKAMQLNRNIEIQRVQVFEGPPRLLQAITADHLMTTAGYKPVILRSSRISTLFNRHLKTEKRTVEAVIPKRSFKSGEVRQGMEVSKARMNGDILEDVGVRAGMRSIFEKRDLLVEAGEKTLPQDLELTTVGAQNLVGMPWSRIINSTIEPPDEAQMERINAASILNTSRVQQLQGKSIEPSTSPPWFLSTKENQPKAKYRKFNYVFEKLQNRWSFYESRGMEKCITLSEFFSFEKDPTRADFLTVLSVIDKMSNRRKLRLQYKDGDVFIFPFETPYVSETQLLLKNRALIF